MLSEKGSRFSSVGQAPKSPGRKESNIRCFVLQIIFVFLFSGLLYRLWELQIINGQTYAEDFELQITRTIREPNTRESYMTAMEKFWRITNWFIPLQ